MSSGRMMLCAPSRAFARLIVAGLLAISAAPLTSGVAEEVAKNNPAGNDCNTIKVKGFQRRPTATHQVTADFLVKPSAGASETEIRNYIAYSHVLAKFSSRQVFKASSGYCAFGANTGTSLNLNFELFSIGENVHNECSLSRCVRALSEFINSTSIRLSDFSKTIDDLVAEFRRSD